MHLYLIIAATALCYGVYNLCIKLSSDGIHPIAGAVALQFVSMLLGLAALVTLRLRGVPVEATSRGLAWAVAAGLAVGLAEILSFYTFLQGVPASVGIPGIVGGTVVVGVALGCLVLGEVFGWRQAVGVTLVLAGIVLLQPQH